MSNQLSPNILAMVKRGEPYSAVEAALDKEIAEDMKRLEVLLDRATAIEETEGISFSEALSRVMSKA